MEDIFYSRDVSFRDPLNEFQGVERYRSNVNMLAGRTLLGKFAFEDAKLQLHDITEPEEGNDKRLRSRWTLKFTFKLLPWKPVTIFTGVSEYTLDSDYKITAQQDYWDSINLAEGGKYVSKPAIDGLKDFINQLFVKEKKTYAMPELPYILLRRKDGYQVRSYPGYEAIEVEYEKRSDAWEMLGSYVAGDNASGLKQRPFVPSIMQIKMDDVGKVLDKRMSWPMKYIPPGAK